MYAFEEFPKIPRLKREVVITEKVDGTNAQVAWVEIKGHVQHFEGGVDVHATGGTVEGCPGCFASPDEYRNDPLCLGVYPGLRDGDSAMALYAGSRTRWLGTSSGADNFGFAKWVLDHAEELRALGPGRHYGEWYGLGIQRNYGLKEKRFALFNVARWNPENPNKPACCDVVPLLSRGEDVSVDTALGTLKEHGSFIAPGFMNPEGIVVFHSASRQLYKMTFKEDGGKWRGPAQPLPSELR